MKLLGRSTLFLALLLSSALAVPAGQIQELSTTKGSGHGVDSLKLFSSLKSNYDELNKKIQRYKRHWDGRCFMYMRSDLNECDCESVYYPVLYKF
ncbi:hypothetical protein L596_030623 [Steinernema carpocapsae]|uniref:Uncharacterized protein n=1 Tax=Steinernema carpocapsae TaxID=34508 RepID=A0A4U5LPY4_STECR|nr:hypothetical protein L596_030623 [Steinernema carpocapsae]